MKQDINPQGMSVDREQAIPQQSIILLVVSLVAFVLLAIAVRVTPLIDDAAINFRYVDMILQGEGVTYNPGDAPVFGSSTPLCLALLALVAACVPSYETAANLINLSSFALAGWLLFRILLNGEDSRHWWLPALGAVWFGLFQPENVLWSTQGLESGLHILLCVAAIYYYVEKRETACGVLIGLTMIDKLDGVAVALAIGLASLIQDRRVPWRTVASASLIFGLWAAVATLYFGSVIPDSLEAKRLREFAAPGAFGFLKHFMQPSIVLTLLGVLLWRRRGIPPLLLFFACYAGLYGWIAGPHPFPWYFVPAEFVRSTVAAFAVLGMLTLARIRQPLEVRRRVLSGAIVVLVAAAPVIALEDFDNDVRWLPFWASSIEQDRVDFGQWLAQRGAAEETVITGHGWIAHLSKMRVIDHTGINDPSALSMMKGGLRHPREALIEQRHPEYLAGHRFEPPQSVRDEYLLVAVFERTSKSTNHADWTLWARRDSAAMRGLVDVSLPLRYPARSEIQP